jgi:hypothetical protein
MIISSFDIINQEVKIISENSITSNYKIYSCVDSYPRLAAKKQLADQIIRVFLPIILLCICNLSIAVCVSKARNNTTKFFSDAENNSICSIQKNEYINKKSSITFNKQLLESRTYSNIDISDCENDLTVFDKISSYSFIKSKFECLKLITNFFNKTRIQKVKKRINSLSSRKHNCSVSARDSNYISIMLVSVSIGFITLNLPFAIKKLYEQYFHASHNKYDIFHGHSEKMLTKINIINEIKYDFLSYITYFLLDLNYISNFFFYFLASSKFRRKLYFLICCKNSRDKKYSQKSNYYSNSYNLRKMSSNI